MAEGQRDAPVSTNPATTKIPIWKYLQLTNDLEVYTHKVIVIAAFTKAVYHVPLLQSLFIYLRPWDITTFEVNVTDDDLEKSYIFDNKTYITSNVHFLIYV